MKQPFLDRRGFALHRAFSPVVWLLGTAISLLILSALTSSATKAQPEDPIVEAKESEARLSVAAMNKAQQAYYLEQGVLVDSISKLGIRIEPETANYNYSIEKQGNAVFSYGIARQENLRSIVGGVFIVNNATETIICQAKGVGMTRPAIPSNNKGVLACGTNTTPITVRLEPTPSNKARPSAPRPIQ